MRVLVEKAEAVLSEHTLCTDCLGRMFAGLSGGLTNRDRGRALLTVLSMELYMEILDGGALNERLLKQLIRRYKMKELERIMLDRGLEMRGRDKQVERCEICRGIFEDLGSHTERIVREVGDYEFDTFLIGISVPTEVEEREDKIRTRHQLKFAENIRSELSREVGKHLKERLKKGFSLNPDLTIHFNPFTQKLRLIPRKIKMSGKVRLSDPEVQVFAHQCEHCSGKGCSHCNHLGKRGEESLEYIIGSEVLKEAEARRWRFGVKRPEEDIVTFTLIIIHPKKKTINLDEVRESAEKRGRGLFSIEEMTF
ncbi:MAG: hypothetical protein GTN80_02080 [Nitrososphaeria archaeon]|nr:hypothetical protein [Nitrososphaeria archaeon]NIN51879.1 hypothetical protein [Nitrososphaeria archaeon]NIQ32427.1 hypothetical protein [Nitrososphaeria archaeon]